MFSPATDVDAGRRTASEALSDDTGRWEKPGMRLEQGFGLVEALISAADFPRRARRDAEFAQRCDGHKRKGGADSGPGTEPSRRYEFRRSGLHTGRLGNSHPRAADSDGRRDDGRHSSGTSRTNYNFSPSLTITAINPGEAWARSETDGRRTS